MQNANAPLRTHGMSYAIRIPARAHVERCGINESRREKRIGASFVLIRFDSGCIIHSYIVTSVQGYEESAGARRGAAWRTAKVWIVLLEGGDEELDDVIVLRNESIANSELEVRDTKMTRSRRTRLLMPALCMSNTATISWSGPSGCSR